MSTKEAARLWNKGEETIKRNIRSGKIIAERLDENSHHSAYIILRDQPNPFEDKKQTKQKLVYFLDISIDWFKTSPLIYN